MNRLPVTMSNAKHWYDGVRRITATVAAEIKRRYISILFAAVYALMSIFVMLHFLHSSLLGDVFYRTQFEQMVNGTAWKPFVYRILIPKATQAITKATPEAWQNDINQNLQDLKFDQRLDSIRKAMPKLANAYPMSQQLYPRAVATLLIYACLWGYIWAMYRLAGSLFPGERAVQLFAPIFGMLLIPSFSWQFLYVYDIPVLFLSTACYYCMAERKIRAYLVFFTLACLNKESAIIILIFFTLWFYHRLPARHFVTLWAAQCLVYAIIKVGLTFTYYYNAGWFLENNIAQVLGRDLFSRSGYTRILTISIICFLLTFRWPEKPLFLKYVFVLLPCMYVAYVLFGYPGEYRVFFDILPLMALLGTHTLIAGTGISQSPVFTAGRSELPR
jgi:hypothetical protein